MSPSSQYRDNDSDDRWFKGARKVTTKLDTCVRLLKRAEGILRQHITLFVPLDTCFTCSGSFIRYLSLSLQFSSIFLPPPASYSAQASTMQDAITLAWAVRVDHAQLGARLEAYVDTKAAISTLRACIAHSDIRSMSSLPPELVAMIVGTLKDLVYNQKIQGWITARECLQNDCKTTDHFTEEELRDIEYPYDSDNEDYLWPESMEIHRNTIEAHMKKITLPTSNNVVRKFARCKEVSIAGKH